MLWYALLRAAFTRSKRKRPIRVSRAWAEAIANAVWLRRRYPAAGYVNAIVCISGDRPPKQYGNGWIVGVERLADWLATDPGR